MTYIPRSQIKRAQRNESIRENSTQMNGMVDNLIQRGEGSFSPDNMVWKTGHITLGDFRAHLNRQVASGTLKRTRKEGRSYYGRN